MNHFRAEFVSLNVETSDLSELDIPSDLVAEVLQLPPHSDQLQAHVGGDQ
jgi:hypothetical protein